MNSSPPLSFVVVIATMERPGRLRDTLESVAAQTRLPESVVVVDASDDEESLAVCREFEGRLSIDYQRAREKSAARQRNQGCEGIDPPLIAFIDDDVVLEPDVFGKLAAVFERRPDTGAVAARMRGFGHSRPRGLLRMYYRLQAGYSHPTWGGRIFGAAINCLPCYDEDKVVDADLIAGNWAPSTVLMTSLQAFDEAGGFPNFTGYSFMEDAWLTAVIAKSRKVWFHTTAMYDHYPSISSAKRDRAALARMRMSHRDRMAREVLGMRGWRLWWRMQLLRLFDTVALARQRGPGWFAEVRGTWSLRDVTGNW